LLNDIDSSIYALREDNQVMLFGGGTLSLTLATDTFAWDEDFTIVNSINGGAITVVAGSLVVTAGQMIYIGVTRPISGTSSLSLSAASSLGSDENKFFIGMRIGDNLYIRGNTKVTGV
jgi:hypothetical protein